MDLVEPQRPDHVEVLVGNNALTVIIHPNPFQVWLHRLIFFSSGTMGLFFALIATFTTSPLLGLVLLLSIALPFLALASKRAVINAGLNSVMAASPAHSMGS